MRHKNDVEFNAKLYGKQKFGFRKLSIGLVTVALGTTFYLTNGELVHADEATANTNQGEAKTEVVETGDKSQSPDTSAKTEDASKQTSSTTNSVAESSKEEASGTATIKAPTAKDNKVDTSSADALKESKIPVSRSSQDQTVTVEAHEMDANNQATSKPTKSSMMAGQDNAKIDIKIDNPKIDSNNQLIIGLPDAGDKNSGKPYKLSVQMGSKDLDGDDSGNWDLDTEPAQIIATWKQKNPAIASHPTSLNVTFSVQGNRGTIKQNENGQTFHVQIGDKIYNAFTADLTPYKDKVQDGEILKGFSMGNTTVGAEKGFGNISSDEVKKYDLDDDRLVNQWGIYFNYGSQKDATILNPLMNAVFNTKFSGDQFMIPSSIKIYEVPRDLAVDDSGYRHGEDDEYINPSDPSDPTQSTTYYNKITTRDGSQRPSFQKFLQAHVTYDENGKPNGFAVDQSGQGLFNIDGDKDYSKHAYFIQVDTVMIKPNEKPGDGTYITSQHLDGQGNTIVDTETWTGLSAGGGTGQNQTENAHVRFYDDTDKKFIDSTPTLDATGVDTTPISFNGFDTSYNAIDPAKYQFVDITSGTQTAGQVHEGTQISTDHTKPNFGNYDTDPSVDQNFVVHFIHKTSQSTQTATITENITYQYENGPHAGNNIQNPTTKTVKYSRADTTDLVTGKITEGTWSPSNNTDFSAITYPNSFPGIDENRTEGNIYNRDDDNIKVSNSDSTGAVTDDGQKDAKLSIDSSKFTNGGNYTYTVIVPYKLTEQIMVHFIDEDENNGTEIATSRYTGDPTNNTANNTSKTLQDLENEGYLLDVGATNGVAGSAHNPNLSYDYAKDNFKGDSDGNKYDADKLTFDNDENLTNQQYYVYLHHNVVTDVEEKTITENIKYVDEADGHEIHNAYASGKLTFSRDVYTDKVTGKTTYSKWSVGAFKPVTNPSISDYTIDPNKITEKLNGNDRTFVDHNAQEIGEADFHKLSDGEITALKDGSTLDFVVPYTRNPEPTPTPTPSNPSNPTNPTEPTSPTTPAPVHPETPENPEHHEQSSNVRPHATNENEENNNTSDHSGHTGNVTTVRPHAQSSYNYVERSKTSRVEEHHYGVRTLPQTGDSQNSLGILGLGIASLASLFGLAGTKKRKN